MFLKAGRGVRETSHRLPADHRVFPGHGPATTAGAETTGNPVVRPA